MKTNITETFQITLHNLKRLLNGKSEAISQKQSSDGYKITVGSDIIWAPGPRRWRMYRKGLNHRLQDVSNRYGLVDIPQGHEDSWAIDVGAFMGEWALHMLRKGYNVLSIEPDPAAAVCARKNISQHYHGPRKWILEQRVALDTNKEVSFYSSAQNADGSIFQSTKHPSHLLTLQATTLDDIISTHPYIQDIAYLKMDAEGAEPEVLDGASNTLTRINTIGIDAGAERQGENTIIPCRERLLRHGFVDITIPPPPHKDIVVMRKKT